MEEEEEEVTLVEIVDLEAGESGNPVHAHWLLDRRGDLGKREWVGGRERRRGRGRGKGGGEESKRR